MTGFHAIAGLDADRLVGVIGLLMALTLVVGNIVTRRTRLSYAAWPALLWMGLVWIAIIATAALAFRHFRPGGF